MDTDNEKLKNYYKKYSKTYYQQHKEKFKKYYETYKKNKLEKHIGVKKKKTKRELEIIKWERKLKKLEEKKLAYIEKLKLDGIISPSRMQDN